MDEHIERGDDTSPMARNAVGRREMLKRTGFVVGAAVLWGTPLVQTIGMRPAAASVVILDACPDTGGGAGQASDLTWKVVPGRADTQSNTSTSPPETETNTAIIDGSLACLEAPWEVQVEVFQSKNIGGSSPDFTFNVQSGSPTFTVPGMAAAWTSFRITTILSGGDDTCGPQTIEQIHTSCSKPLEVDFWWGAIELVTVGAAGSKGW